MCVYIYIYIHIHVVYTYICIFVDYLLKFELLWLLIAEDSKPQEAALENISTSPAWVWISAGRRRPQSVGPFSVGNEVLKIDR